MFNPEAPFCVRPRFDLELFSRLWKFRRACNEHYQSRAMPILRDLSFASLQLFEEVAAQEGPFLWLREERLFKTV
jgi:D-amino-acid dehydrogenase